MEYKLIFVDHILDNIYGQIGITKVEKELERIPIFKRLHHISQLGMANFVFPCALHNRYVHSIGVMHTAYDMAIHINMNYAKENDGKSFFNEEDLQIIRLAGMLHDIGHYPMSHNIEKAYKDIEKMKKNESLNISEQETLLVNYPSFLKEDISDKFENYIKQYNESTYYHHEAIGKEIIENNQDIFNIIKDNFVQKSDYLISNKTINKKKDLDNSTKHLLSFIASIIVGNYSACNSIYDDSEYKYNKKYSAMIQLIHSELDADNLDYLMRDSTFSGTSYGSIDISVLLNNLEVREITERKYFGSKNQKKTRKKYLIGINRKGISLVDQFYLNKFFSYGQVIFNKYVSSLEFMLLEWAKQFALKNIDYSIKPDKDNRDIRFMPLVKSNKSEIKYLNFTDSYILEEIRKKARKSNKDDLLGCIYSKLAKNQAFDIDKKYDDGDYQTVGCEKDINNLLLDSTIYKNYKKLITKIGSCKYKNLSDDIRKELLSYRFESFSMTKQIPFNIINEYANNSYMDEEDTIFANYCRLATGVPVFNDNRKYQITIFRNFVSKNDMPELIVDCKSSLLSKMYDYKLVYLRKYIIKK